MDSRWICRPVGLRDVDLLVGERLSTWSVSVLVDYLLEFGACASDFGEDGFGGGRPDVGLGIGVVGVEVCLDAGDQVGHTGEDSAA